MGTRDEIAQALSAVAGVTGTPTRPAVPAKGAAWPVYVQSGQYTLCDLLDTWWVIVVVAAGDEPSVALAAETLIAPVWNALEEIAEIVLCEAMTMEVDKTGMQSLPILRYTITTTRERNPMPQEGA